VGRELASEAGNLPARQELHLLSILGRPDQRPGSAAWDSKPRLPGSEASLSGVSYNASQTRVCVGSRNEGYGEESMTDYRPSWDEYFMNMAEDASTRSNCLRRKVGALVVKQRSIISTGYNGTPIGVKNCFEGGCPRCLSDVQPGQGYDTCICVHAEANAILLAARHGNATEAGVLYTTMRPCFSCLKEAIQAGITEIVYERGDEYEGPLEDAYQALVRDSNVRLRQFVRRAG
jgi:dCMP deaminase